MAHGGDFYTNTQKYKDPRIEFQILRVFVPSCEKTLDSPLSALVF